MNAKLLAASAAVALVVVAALAVVTGVVPLDGDPDGDVAPSTDAGTPSAPDSEVSDAGGSDVTTTEPPPFSMVVESVESCGQTCRDVTVRLVNNQDREATGVTVTTRIYAGDDTTGDPVWEGTADVGTLGPGESIRETQRVELGLMEAAAVQETGEITIQTVVETDRQTVRFVEHRDVS